MSLFGDPEGTPCCCSSPLQCADCNDTFPSEVNVLIPSLGISDVALLTLSGDDTFLYLWEGGNEEYSWQADFACTDLNFGISKNDASYICIADNGPPTTVRVDIVSCYPDPLQIIYTFECVGGGSLTVVLMGA